MGQKEVQNEMDEMEKSIEALGSMFETAVTDPPGTEAPGTQVPGTESLGTEAPGAESPSTEAPGTSAPATEPPEEDPRDAELRVLREENERLKKPKATEAPPTKAPPTKAPATDAPIEDVDFLGDTDLDELTRDPKLFNQLLNKVHKSGVERGRADSRSLSESVVRSIPDIVKHNITITTKLREATDKFYEDNEDLKNWKPAVATVFQEKMNEDPSKRYDEIMDDVATEVRKRIGLRKEAGDKDKGNKPPNLPNKKKGSQRQTAKPDLSEFERELDAMDSALDKF